MVYSFGWSFSESREYSVENKFWRMRVALNARVSTKDKEQDPETQFHALRAYCEAQGHAVAAAATGSLCCQQSSLRCGGSE